MTHLCHTSQHWAMSMCSCWKYLEKSNVHMLPFLYLIFSQILMQSYAQRNTPTHKHTHTHNAFTVSMPCDRARHYANRQTCHLPEISETKWESTAAWVCERDSAHLSICEKALSSVTIVHRQGTWNVAATVICYVVCVVCGGSEFWEKRATWSLRANVESFWGTCHVYCSLSKFLEGFLKSM